MSSATPMRLAVMLAMLVMGCGGADGRDEPRTADRAAAGDSVAERPYAFTTLEYPGAATTIASDVTDDGIVVGWYVADSIPRGFVYREGRFTPVEYPGAVLTHVTGMAADGSLVGAYRRAGEPPIAWHGFLRRPSGEFVDVRHPDHPHSMAQRILGDGTIVGCYHGDDYTTTMFATATSGEQVAVLDTPGSMYTGGTPDGRRLVGNLYVEGRAFVAEDGRVTHLEAPGSASTEAWDINAAGLIVGTMVDSAQVSRGFVLDDGQWTPLQVPDAKTSVAFGVNARGDVVGGWEDAQGKRRAFLATRR